MARIVVTYRFRASTEEAEPQAHRIAVEQSVEMPVRAISDRYVLNEIVGEVQSLREIVEGEFEARIALSAASVGEEGGQFLNVLFGNSSLYPDVVLHDVEIPASVAAVFGGPRLGIDGLRRRLRASSRPLTLCNLKPQGLTPVELAGLAAKISAGGVDMIKDDHGLADQTYSPFAERVPRIAEAVHDAAARTGVATRYLPHVTGDLEQMRARISLVRTCGLDGILVLPMVVGLSTFQRIRRENPDLAIVAHPAMAGATRIAPAVLMGTLFRLLGADATVFPGFGGRFGGARDECQRLAHFARRPRWTLLPTLPIPAGGMTAGTIAELFDFYGRDVGLFLGGSLLASARELTDAAANFVAAVHALGKYATPAPAEM